MVILEKILTSVVAQDVLIGIFEILAKSTKSKVDDGLVSLLKQVFGRRAK